MRYLLELKNNEYNDKCIKIKELEDKIIKKHSKYKFQKNLNYEEKV